MATKKEMMIAVKAVQSNFCNQKQVQKCLEIQRNLKQEKDQDISLLTIMKKKGYLTAEQIQAVKDSLPKISQIRVEDNPIEGYQLLEKIGQGGMAVVFRATHPKHGEIALKILFPHHNSNEEYVNGFMNEAKLVCTLTHPNLVKGMDYGKSNDHHYLAMEYVKGSRSVKDVLDTQGAFDEDTALSIILQIAKALFYISSCGILHRDIKPDNTLITQEGEVKVCDLGFAKMIEKSGKKSGLTCGTVQYISPEQAKGQGDVDVRSDIYSLGATLYHLVMGKVPFTGADSMEVMAKQVLEGLNDIKNRKISQHMHYFIEKMMAKDRDIRYQDPQELIDDIEKTIEGKKSLRFNSNEVKKVLFELQSPEAAPKTDTRMLRSDRTKKTSDLGKTPSRPLEKTDENKEVSSKPPRFGAFKRTSQPSGSSTKKIFEKPGQTTKPPSQKTSQIDLTGLQNLLSPKNSDEKPHKGSSILERRKRR